MNKRTEKPKTLSIFVFESVFVSEEIIADVIIIKIVISGYLHFDAKEIVRLRETLRISIGSHADRFTEDDLIEFGTSVLRATAIVLKAKYLRNEYHLKNIKN